MAIIVEDGSGVANANSYVSVADAQAWLEVRGLSFTSEDDAVIGAFLIQAMDFLESFRAQFKGAKTSSTQSLQWPRANVYIDNVEVDDDVIPVELVNALVQLAYEAQTVDLQPTATGQEVLKEKVGPIETEYAESGRSVSRPRLTKVMSFLEPLLVNSASLRVVRA